MQVIQVGPLEGGDWSSAGTLAAVVFSVVRSVFLRAQRMPWSLKQLQSVNGGHVAPLKTSNMLRLPGIRANRVVEVVQDFLHPQYQHNPPTLNPKLRYLMASSVADFLPGWPMMNLRSSNLTAASVATLRALK